MTVPTFTGDSGRCFWCRKHFNAGLTRDHLTPKWAGGADLSANIVPACGPCNADRGRVTRFAAAAAEARASRLHPVDVEALRDQAPEIDDLRGKWFDLEMERLGYSPTIELDVSLPPAPDPPAPDPPAPDPPAPDPEPYRLRDPRYTEAERDRFDALQRARLAAHKVLLGESPNMLVVRDVPKQVADQRAVLAKALAASEAERERLLRENAELKAAAQTREKEETPVPKPANDHDHDHDDDDDGHAVDDAIEAAMDENENDVADPWFDDPPEGTEDHDPPVRELLARLRAEAAAEDRASGAFDPPQAFRTYVFGRGVELRLEQVTRVSDCGGGGWQDVTTAGGRRVRVRPTWLWVEYPGGPG